MLVVCFFLLQSNILLYVYFTGWCFFKLHLAVDGHLAYFPFLANINKANINITYIHILILVVQMPKSGMTES
jgi:hypothetical protein